MDDPEKPTPKRQRKISWWKLGLGLLFLLAGLKNLDQRNVPAELMPSSETQWFGYFLATAIFILAGLIFMIAGLRHLWLDRPD